jgi:predicted DCC family thiol-disulfide oxidoreductase YuxK
MMEKDVQEILKLQPILLFDGECGFCNKSIQFFLERERKKVVHFASLQSDTGKILRKYFEIGDKVDSVILIKDHSAFIKSCAALRMTRYMKGLWPMMMVFVMIPPFIRNIGYDFIAKRRMKWFGRIENCALLQKEDKVRFIEM